MDFISLLQRWGPYAPAVAFAWLAAACLFAFWRTRQTRVLSLLWVCLPGLLYMTFTRSWAYEPDVWQSISYTLYAILPLLVLFVSYASEVGWFGKVSRTRALSESSLVDMLLFRVPARSQPVPPVQVTVTALPANRSSPDTLFIFGVIFLLLGFAGECGVGLQPCNWLDTALARSGCIVQLSYGSSVQTLAFSPDGSTLVVGGAQDTADLHSVPDGRLVRTFAGHSSWVIAADFSPDGSMLATASWDHTVRLWRVADGSTVHVLKPSERASLATVAYSPDGKTVAAADAGSPGQVWVWRADDGSLVRTISADSYNFAFSPDSSTLANFRKDGNIVLTRLSDGATISTLPVRLSAPDGGFRKVQFSPDGSMLAYQSGEVIRFLSLPSGQEVRTIAIGGQAPTVAFSRDWKLLASSSAYYTIDGSDHGGVVLWRIDGAQLAAFPAGRDPIDALAIAPDYRILSVATPWSWVRLWRARY